MPVEILSLRNRSPNLTSYAKKSWDNLTNFHDENDNDNSKDKSSDSSYLRLLNRSQSIKRKRAVPILNISNPNNSAIHSNQASLEEEFEDEEYFIEDFSDEEEPKTKKIGLCTERGNQIIVNLSQFKNKRNSSIDLTKQLKQKQMSHSHPLRSTRSSSKLNNNLSNGSRMNRRSLQCSNNNSPRNTTRLSQSVNNKSTLKSNAKIQKQQKSLVKINSQIASSKTESILISHSTPKGN